LRISEGDLEQQMIYKTIRARRHLSACFCCVMLAIDRWAVEKSTQAGSWL